MICAAALFSVALASNASNSGFSGPDVPPAVNTNAPTDISTLAAAMAKAPIDQPANVPPRGATHALVTNGMGSGFASLTSLTPTPIDIFTNGMEELDDKYRLAIGDSINFQIKEDEDDPQAIPVTDSGDIEVPYIGRYPASGKTCKELAGQLKEQLEKKYYYRATVIISVKSMTSKGVIYLIGGVRTPGPLEIPRDDVLTVSKAILRAGGFDDFGDQKDVQVRRKTDAGTNEVFIINVSAVLDKGNPQKDLQVEPGDLIFVPEKTIRF